MVATLKELNEQSRSEGSADTSPKSFGRGRGRGSKGVGFTGRQLSPSKETNRDLNPNSVMLPMHAI